MTLLLPVAGLLFTVSVIVALHLSVLGAGVVLCVAGMVIGARIDRVLTVVFLVLLLIWLVGGTLFHVGDVPIELGLLVLAGLVQAWSLSIRPDGGTETARDRAMWQMSNVGASCALMAPVVSLLRVDTVDDPGLCFLFGLLGLVGAMFQLDMRASVAPQRISPAGVLGTRYRVLARSSEQVFGIEKAPVLSIFPHLSDEQRIIENIVLRNVLFIFQPLSRKSRASVSSSSGCEGSFPRRPKLSADDTSPRPKT